MTCQQCTTTPSDANLNCKMTDHLCILTPLSRVFLEKLTVPQLVTKFPAILATWIFVTAFKQSHHVCLSSHNNRVQDPPPPLPPVISWRTILILFSHVSLGLPSGLFPSGCHQNPICISPLTHMCYMPCPSQYDYNEQYLVRITDHAAPHYSIFSIPPLPHPSHPKYPPQHPILKHTQPCSLLSCQCHRPSLTLIYLYRQVNLSDIMLC